MTRPRTGLDWRSRAHWGGDMRLPCIHCGTGASCRDVTGQLCHKTCAEAVMFTLDGSPGAASNVGSEAA